jgi:hypothetical protein
VAGRSKGEFIELNMFCKANSLLQERMSPGVSGGAMSQHYRHLRSRVTRVRYSAADWLMEMIGAEQE